MKTGSIMALFVLLACTQMVYAEELVIQLKSGNTIKVRYEGAIQGVSLDGKTDGIEGFRIEGQAPMAKQGTTGVQAQAASSSTAAQPVNVEGARQPVKQPETKDSKDGWFYKLKWAAPKSED